METFQTLKYKNHSEIEQKNKTRVENTQYTFNWYIEVYITKKIFHFDILGKILPKNICSRQAKPLISPLATSRTLPQLNIDVSIPHRCLLPIQAVPGIPFLLVRNPKAQLLRLP